MNDINDTLEALQEAGCTVRTVHMRPITEYTPNVPPLDFGDELDMACYEKGSFPDGGIQICMGTKEQLLGYQRAFDNVRFHDTGGQTHVTITTPEGEMFRGVAVCMQEQFDEKGRVLKGDQFNRKLGRAIAFGRAVKNMEKSREIAFRPDAPYLEPQTHLLSELLGELFKEFIPADEEPTEVFDDGNIKISFWG